MKKFKKLKLTLAALAVSALMPLQVFAANGTIAFSDLNTKTGESFEMKVAVTASEGAIGDATVTMKYDPAALEFESGEGVQAGTNPGELVFTGKGDGTSQELRTVLKFRALKEGNQAVNVASYTASSQAGTALELETGSSAITVEKGADVPEAGTADKTDAEGQGDAKSDAKPDAEENEDSIWISDTYSIMLLNEKPDVKFPAQYLATELMLNGQNYPAWQDQDKSSYYIVYAQNSQGEKELYQYDSKEGTYQRFILPKAEEQADTDSFTGKIKAFVQENLMLAVIVAAAAILILLILVIVLSVRLHSSSRELDELYEEGIGRDKSVYDYRDTYEEEFDDDSEYDEDDDYEDDYDEDDDYDDEEEYDEDDYDDEERKGSGSFSVDFIDLD